MTAPAPRTIVLGLGNPVLTDDAVGLLAVRAAAAAWGDREGVIFREASVGGFELLELLAGFDAAIIVDAIKTGAAPPGALHALTPEDLPPSLRLQAVHEIDLATAIALGERLGVAMPKEVAIIGVEVEDDLTLGEQPTPAVAAAVPAAAARILEGLARRYS